MAQQLTLSSWHKGFQLPDNLRCYELSPAGHAVEVKRARLPVCESHPVLFALTQIGTSAPSPRVNYDDSVSKPYSNRSYGGRT